jgi:hypothetical protein
VERHPQRLELVAAHDRRICLGRRLGEPALVDGAEVVGVDGDLLGPARAPQVVDARILRDLVDPRTEGDLLVRAAQGAQGRHEGLLHDVLRAAMVGHHPADVADDTGAVAAEERLEGLVAALPGGDDQLLVGCLCGCRGQQRFHRRPFPSG